MRVGTAGYMSKLSRGKSAQSGSAIKNSSLFKHNNQNGTVDQSFESAEEY